MWERYFIFTEGKTSLGNSPHRLCEAQHCLPYGNLVLCPQKRNDVDLRSNDVCNCVAKRCCVLTDTNTKRKDTIFIVSFFLGPTLKMEPVKKLDFLFGCFELNGTNYMRLKTEQSNHF